MITNFKIFENESSVIYRLGTENDLIDIKKITNKLRNELGFVMNVALKDAILHDELLVAELDNKVIGFIHFHKRKDGWNTIHELGVLPDYQKLGIGKKLFNMIPKPVRLKTTVDNLTANAFYKYQGMENIGREKGKKRELNIWTKESVNESLELSGKHSFFTFLQIISNHDFHFVLNDHYTKLYKYHLFFSTETITKVDEYIEIFKYKHSLASTYEILKKINGNKLAFFFGIKENNVLRYGIVDLDTQRSYVVGEFNITDGYFKSIVKYKALQSINKIIQNLNVKHLSTISKIKQDFEKFYPSKKNLKIKIEDNKIINYYNRSEFTNEEINMNRLYRTLDKWISKKSWRNNVEYSVDDDEDPIKFIIIVK